MTLAQVPETMKLEKDFYSLDARGIPIEHIQKLLDFLPQGHPMRIGIQILLYTGCRISEVNNMNLHMLNGNVLYFSCGKNQTGQMRREFFPDSFLNEYKEYRETYRLRDNQFFGWSAATFRRKFNQDVRPHLGEEWNKKRFTPSCINRKNGKYEYVLQLKGFRKNFVTFVFYHYWKKFQSAEMAMHLTCARMKHSSTGMTVQHYIIECESLKIQNFAGMLPIDVVHNHNQSRILDWAI